LHIYEYLTAFEIFSERNLFTQDQQYLHCKKAYAAPFLLFHPFSLSPLFLLTLRIGLLRSPAYVGDVTPSALEGKDGCFGSRLEGSFSSVHFFFGF